MTAWSRPLPLAATLGAAALACAYGGMILQGTVHHVAPLLAPSLLASAPLFYLLFTRRLTRRESLGPRAFPSTVMLSAVAAPIFAGLAHLALTVPLVKVTSGRSDDFIAAAKVFGVALGAGIVLASALATWMRASDGRRVGWVLAIVAPAALALEMVLVAAGMASPRPAPNRYVSSLPVLGRTPPSLPVTGEDTTDVGDVAVTRRCAKTPCGVWVTPRGTAPPLGDIPDFSVVVPDVLVRRDAARDLWIADASGSTYDLLPLDDVPARLAAYRGPDAVRAEIHPRTLEGGLAPPQGWIVLATLGAVIAAVRLSRRRSAKQALREILAAEAGTIDEAGFITLDRDGPLLRAPTAGLAPGPVLVMDTDAARAASSTYRTDDARPAERVLAGTREYLTSEARHAIATIDARTLMAVLITAAPLATAWLDGLR